MEKFINFKVLIFGQVYFTVIIFAVIIQASHGRGLVGIRNKVEVSNGAIISSENKGGSLGPSSSSRHKYNDTGMSADHTDTNLEQFQIQTEDVLNPGFHNWRENEMQKKMTSSKSLETGNSSRYSNRNRNRRRRHVNLNTSFSYSLRFPTSITNIDLVVIGTRADVLSAFKGELMQYGTNNQALMWSSRTFHTFILQKSGKRIIGNFECGQMYIAARLLNGYPTYIHDFYPTQVRNPLGGNLRFPIYQRCDKIS